MSTRTAYKGLSRHWRQNSGNYENIDDVSQGNWSLSIEGRFKDFAIVEYYKKYAKAVTYSPDNSKISGCNGQTHSCTKKSSDPDWRKLWIDRIGY